MGREARKTACGTTCSFHQTIKLEFDLWFVSWINTVSWTIFDRSSLMLEKGQVTLRQYFDLKEREKCRISSRCTI